MKPAGLLQIVNMGLSGDAAGERPEAFLLRSGGLALYSAERGRAPVRRFPSGKTEGPRRAAGEESSRFNLSRMGGKTVLPG